MHQSKTAIIGIFIGAFMNVLSLRTSLVEISGKYRPAGVGPMKSRKARSGDSLPDELQIRWCGDHHHF